MSSSTTYTMQVGSIDVTPNVDNLLITLDGVIQHPSTAYTVSGSTLTFDTAPGTGVEFYGVVMGQSASFGEGSIGADELKVTGDGSSGQVLASDGDGTFTWTTDTENYLPLAGGTMSGAINLGSQNVTNGGTITGTFVGGITGNASTATALATARTIGGTSFDGTANIAVALAATATTLATTRAINGVNFDGSAAITVTADANTLSGTTLKSTVVTSSLTSVGTLTTLTVDNVILNGTTIGHTSDTDLMTLASGVLTVTGNVVATGSITSGDLILKSPTNNGHYTIWEEEEYLAIRNEMTGKKYKFVLEEIE
jgi:hypothetical protein